MRLLSDRTSAVPGNLLGPMGWNRGVKLVCDAYATQYNSDPMRQLLLFPPYWKGNWASEGLNDILQSQSQDPKSSISDPKSVLIYFLSAPGEKTICFRRETVTHLGKVDWILVWYDRGCDGRLAIPHFYPLSHLRVEPEENKEYFPGACLKGRWQSLWSRVAWTWVMLEASIIPSDFRNHLYSQRLVESLISSGACKNYIDRNFKRYLEIKIQKSAWYFSCPMKYIFIHRKSRTAVYYSAMQMGS